MTPELQNYLNFNPKDHDDDYAEQRRLRSLVDPKELRAYNRQQIDKFFVPENQDITTIKSFESPSGKYKLTISQFNTKKGCWSYSQGQIFSLKSDTPLAIVNRNYGSFPFLFIENHPNGHDYLVCGEDYQGHTVIELDTGKRADHLPNEAEDGFGFCSAIFSNFNLEHQLLLVDGCYWGGPYEFKFYDFSDPLNKFQMLEDEDGIFSDARKPTFEPDGTIKTYYSYENTNEDDDESVPGELAATKTFRREGDKLILLSEDVSEKEKDRRIRNEKAEKEWEEFVHNYKLCDPIWLRFQELIKESTFKPSSYSSVGYTYKDWCPTWSGEEKRFCQRIFDSHGKGYTFDIEIAHASGPIKLVQYKEGKTLDPMFFDHSIQGIEEAIQYAKERLLGA